MSIFSENRFLFGASCAPYAKSMDWPESEWDGDFATMRTLHFNVIRIFAAWDRIERVEGVFDYARQDHALELAEKRRLGVILNFGGVFSNLCGIYSPGYMSRKYGCRPRQGDPAAPAHDWAPGAVICPDTPVYREKAFAFMARTVERYAGAEALLAWMTWNEPASYACYCPHTLARFREWLHGRYRDDLDELNRAWSTEHPVDYRAWNEIGTPPPALAARRDWLQFNQFRLYDSMGAIDALVRERDPRGRPTTTNLVYHLAAMEGPVNAPQYGLDLGRVGRSVSVLGLSFYTVEHKYDFGTGFLSAYKLSRLRSVSREEKRRLLVLETGAGPNLAMANEAQHRLNFYQLLAHNVKGILLWNYRSRLSDAQSALFNLMKWDGGVTRRARYLAEFSKTLQDNARLLNDAVPDRQAALLTLEEEQVLMDGLCGIHCPSEFRQAHDSRVGAYKLLWDLHIPADCLTECQLEEMGRYRLLLLPAQEHMSPGLAAKIKAYVAAGGTVIAESPFAFRSSDGILQYSAPGFGLEEVFGCRTSDREMRETAPAIRCPDGPAAVCLFWSEYTLNGGAPLAAYGEGYGAAAVGNDYGRGRAVLFGSEVFRQYLADPQPPLTSILVREVLASGARPAARVEGDASGVEISRLDGNGGSMYIFNNHGSGERRFRVFPRGAARRWTEMESGCPFDTGGEIALAGGRAFAIVSRSGGKPGTRRRGKCRR